MATHRTRTGTEREHGTDLPSVLGCRLSRRDLLARAAEMGRLLLADCSKCLPQRGLSRVICLCYCASTTDSDQRTWYELRVPPKRQALKRQAPSPQTRRTTGDEPRCGVRATLSCGCGRTGPHLHMHTVSDLIPKVVSLLGTTLPGRTGAVRRVV